MAMDTGPFASLLSGLAAYGHWTVEVRDADGELAFSSDPGGTEAAPPEERRAFSTLVANTAAFRRAAGNGSGEIFGVPLWSGEKVVGTLTACSRRSRPDHRADPAVRGTAAARIQEMEGLLTSLAGLMQEKWKAQEDLDDLTEELTQSLEILYLYSSAGNQLQKLQVSQEVLDNLTARLLENMELDLGFARVFDGKEYRSLAASAPFSRRVPQPDRFLEALLDSIPADTHTRAHSYFVVNDSRALPAHRALHADPYRLLAVPVQHDQAFYGWLGILSFDMDEIFRGTDLNLLSTIAEQLGAVITNTRKTQELVTLNRKMEAEIEERKRAQEDLTRAFEELKALDRAKDAFLSSVSHEFRTPLTSIRSFSEILLTYEDTPKEDRNEFLRIVISESDRLKRLVDDLLDLSKIEAGKVVWNDERTCLNEVVRDAVEIQQPLFREKSLRFIPDLAEDLPRVLADRDRIQQVVANLLDNAVKFSRDGGEIRIRTETLKGRRADEAPFWVKVSVIDQGMGVEAQDVKTIFDKFCQGSSDTLTDKPKGTGLGLPISKEIVTHYGGNLWVESEPGKGSTFSLTLPGAPGPARPDEEDPPPAVPQAKKELL